MYGNVKAIKMVLVFTDCRETTTRSQSVHYYVMVERPPGSCLVLSSFSLFLLHDYSRSVFSIPVICHDISAIKISFRSQAKDSVSESTLLRENWPSSSVFKKQLQIV